MTDAIEIRTIEQIANLSKDQRKVFLKDLQAWLDFMDVADAMAKVMPEEMRLTMSRDVMHWVDDDRPGEVNAINIKVRTKKDKSK